MQAKEYLLVLAIIGFSSAAVFGQSDTLSALPDTLIVAGGMATLTSTSASQTIKLPIQLRNISGTPIYSARITFATDTSKVSFVGIISGGTLSGGWSSALGPLPADSMRVALADATPITTAGVLCSLIVSIKPGFTAGDVVPLDIRSVLLNEGSPSCGVVSTLIVGTDRAALYLRDTSAVSNVRCVIPVYAANMTGRGVYSIDMRIDFNSAKLAIDSAYASPALPSAWSNVVINKQTSYAQISMAGSDPLDITGPLVFLVMRPASFFGTDTARMSFTAARLNEGAPAVSTRNAVLHLTGAKLAVNVGWNMISFNMQPKDSSCATIFGALPGHILVENNAGQVYWPAIGLNQIGNVATGQGYQLYTDTLGAIVITGAPYNVSTTPISLGAEWNMIAYLPQSSMNITTALAGITSQIAIVKNNAGQVYWPALSINNIGAMNPGEGYMIYMNQAATLTYPSGGSTKRAASADKTIALPLAKHYALSKNTGANATILATDVLLNGKPAGDGSEVGAYDAAGNLVGSGVVENGVTAFSVWGKDCRTKVKDGLAQGEAISLKLWDGSQEYSLAMEGKKLAYGENAILLGKLSVPDIYFVKKFALRGACSGLNGLVRIMFDVPYDNKDVHNVTIDLFDVSGRLARRIAAGQYCAGHYAVTWNSSIMGSGVYIIQMKAESFDGKTRLIIVK